MKHKVTIADVAKLCGVSKSSVSRYLNQGYVSSEHAQRIKEAIETTGFESNFFAKRLKMKQSFLIGIVIQQIHDDRSSRLLQGIQDVLHKRGYQFVIQIADQFASEKERIQSLYQQGVDGFILDFKENHDEHIKLLEKLNRPYIMLKGQGNHSVFIDEQKAGMILGDLFARGNHESIVYIGMRKDRLADEMRCVGIRDAYMSLECECKLHTFEVEEMEDTYLQAGKILNYLPTGILLSNELLGLGILRYLYENDIMVPQSVSMAAFGGDRIGTLMYPKITCIAYDYVTQGKLGAQAIVDMVEGKEAKEVEEITCSLRYGESVRNI